MIARSVLGISVVLLYDFIRGFRARSVARIDGGLGLRTA
jgi:hypothetical protein